VLAPHSVQALALKAVSVTSDPAGAYGMAAIANDLRNARAMQLILPYVSVESRVNPTAAICSPALRICLQDPGGPWMNDGYIGNNEGDIWKNWKDVTVGDSVLSLFAALV
jgi:hypothetical protein